MELVVVALEVVVDVDAGRAIDKYPLVNCKLQAIKIVL